MGVHVHADQIDQAGAAELDPGRASQQAAFALLRGGVPLSLLLDLALPTHSRELLESERADTSWVPRRDIA